MVLMDVKAALGAPIPRAFMPPRPAEYLELQKNVIKYLAHRIQQPIPKLQIRIFLNFLPLTISLQAMVWDHSSITSACFWLF